MSLNTGNSSPVDHQVLRRDLRVILLLSVVLFGAIAALWLIDGRTSFLAKLAG